MDSVIGIDLSGLSRSTRGRTVAAEIALGRAPRLVGRVTIRPGLAGDRDLVDWVKDRRPAVVAIDAPLTLPHGVGCADTTCDRCRPGGAEYLVRDIDRHAGGMPTTMLAAIAFRGIYLARIFRDRGLPVIETYPAAGFRALGVGRDSGERHRVLEVLLGPLPPLGPDELDAVCAALAGVTYCSGGAPEITGMDGEIWLPLRS